MSKKPIALIIDGNALLHRAWHAIPPLTKSDGVIVNAVYGFVNVIEKVRKEYAPDYFAVAWDLPGKTFRHELMESYKGTRVKKEQELYDQIDMIRTFLRAYQIPSLSVEGMEADDVIGSFAHAFCKNDTADVRILTGDMDALQLVNECVHVIGFVKGLSEVKEYDIAAVKEKYGLVPNQLIDLKTLMGDSSDNIPGIAGIGKLTATKLITEFGTIDGVLAALQTGTLKPAIAKKLAGQEETLKLMRTLVTIVTDIPLPATFEEMKKSEPKVDELIKLLREYGFRRVLADYEQAQYAEQPNAEPEQPAKKSDTSFSIVPLSKLTKTKSFFFLQTKSEDLFGSKIAGIAVSDGKHLFTAENPEKNIIADVLAHLNESKEVIGHDVKQAMHVIGEITVPIFDVMIAGYMRNSALRTFDLRTLAQTYTSSPLSESASIAENVQSLMAIETILRKELKDEELETVAFKIEMPLIPVLFRMEKAGIEVNRAHLAQLAISFESEIERLTKRIYTVAGKEFNINSPSQLAVILFEDLQLPTKGIKKTKSGFSTAASELEKLWDLHELVPLVSEYREIAKLKSTYIDTLPLLVQSDGRIHTTFEQSVAATGRLASSNPNMQNIPIRTELGNDIRRAFVAKKGHVLIAADYSQIELRLAAILARDESFLRAFKEGADIHKRTAAEILEKHEDEVTKEERSAAKAINFGILYGMGARNLARSTGFSQEEAKSFIERYFAVHPGIQQYINDTKAFAHEHGFVKTVFGRKRYLPELESHMQMVRASAERIAVNMPLQGTQADLIKMAMIQIDAWLTESKIDAQLLLQVHDELVLEVKEADADTVMQKVTSLMESVWESEIPLSVSVAIGANWAELK